MSGIAKITQRRKEEVESYGKGGQELWLSKDGDAAIVSFIATGDPDDSRLDDFWVHTKNFIRDDGSNGYKTFFCEKALDDSKPCEFVHTEKGQYPSHQFGIWCYVHKIYYADKRNDKCIEEKSKAGATVWAETVGDFRVFSKGFGKGQYLWNQLVDIYNEDQTLTKMLVKISRSGSKMDTTYAIRPGRAKSDLAKELLEKTKDLPNIRDFFRKRYSAESKTEISVQKSDSSQKTVNPLSQTADIGEEESDSSDDDVF